MTTNTQTTTDTTPKESMGTFRTSAALICLYEHAAPLLTNEELTFITGAIEQAQLEAELMQEITRQVGSIVCENEEKNGFSGSMNALFFQISNNLDLIYGLNWVGGSAHYRLNNPDTAFPPRQANSGSPWWDF